MGSKRRIEVIARALLVRDGKLLICRASEGYGYLPGGHVEFNEPADAALRRELMEEAGVAVRVGELCLVAEGRFVQKRDRHEINLVFHVELEDPDAEVVSREPEIEFEWVELDRLFQEDLRPRQIVLWVRDTILDRRPVLRTATFLAMPTRP